MNEQARQYAYNQFLQNGMDMGDGRNASLNPTNVSYDAITNNPQMIANEMKRAEQVIAHRSQEGLDNTAQMRYLANLQKAQGEQLKTPEGQIQNNLINASQGYVQTQQAILEQRKQQQIRELESAYSQAVNDGQMSIKEAENAYKQQVDEINRQAYQDAQVTNLTAQNRGIQNSMQLLGLQAGDNQRNNVFRQNALTERDTRVLDLQNRLKQLALDKNLAISGANTDYNTGLLQAQGEANQQLNDQLFQFNNQNYVMSKEQQYALEQMAQQQEYTQDNMALEQEYTVANMSTQQRYALEQMAKQHGYDLNKMSVQQQNEFARMAQQQAYSSANRQADINAELALMREKNTMERELASFAQQDAIDDELRYYTPGTDEYKLREAQLEAEANAQRQQQFNQVGTEYYLQNAPVKPARPVRSDYNSLFKTKEKEDAEYQSALKDYNEKMDAYNRFMSKLGIQD